MSERDTGCKKRRWSGSGDLVLYWCLFGVNTDAEEGNRQGAKHAQADAGKRVPSQVYGAQAHGKGPEQRGSLEDVEHDLAFHLRSILVGSQSAGDKKQGVGRNG